MNLKYLFQALRFACLPTLSVLTLLFFGFFSISKTIAFIASDNPWAIALRIFLVLAEVVLIIYMYSHYELEDLKQSGENIEKFTDVYDSTLIYKLRENWSSNDTYKLYKCSNPNYVLIKRISND